MRRGAVDLVAELAGEADPQEQAVDAGDARLPRRRGSGTPPASSRARSARASISRLRGPARFIAASPCVRSTSCASIPHAASHQREPLLDGAGAARGRRHVERLVVEPADRAVVHDPAGLGGQHAVADAARAAGRRRGWGRACRAARRPAARARAACRASRRRSARPTRAPRAPRPRGRRSRTARRQSPAHLMLARRSRWRRVHRRALRRLERASGEDPERHRRPRRPRRRQPDLGGACGRSPPPTAAPTRAGTCAPGRAPS